MEYKLGYCMAVIEETNIERYAWLHGLKNQCEKLILGIPDEWIMARLFGDRPYSSAEYRNFLMRTGWFDDVLILDAEHLRYPKLIEKIKPDVIFYGGEYGYNYLQDSEYALSHGVELISLQPEAKNPAGILDAPLRIALEDVTRQQKIVLFGTGAYFDFYMERFGDKYKPAYAVDNELAKWGTTKNGIDIECPDVLQSENPTDTLVIICTRKYQDIKQQLFELGFTRYRTLLYKYEVSILEEFGAAVRKEANYLRESHRILTILMKEFDAVCRENHLHYYFICGSLIGAVRHKGMIPWDDDIDIAMPREDYKKLKRIAKKIWNKNNTTFRFLNYTDIGGGAFLDCMPRLFYMKERLPTKCFDKVMGKATADIEDRLFIDIYVMDRAHVSEKIHNFCTNIAMKGIYNLMMGHRAFVDYDEYRGVIDDKTLKIMKRVHKLGSMLPIRFLAFWYDAFARSGNLNRRAKDVIMESCAIRCVELKYPIEHFGEGQRVPFETIEVMIPSNYDAQLQDMRYRNYMEFPSMSVRKPSHYFNSDIEIW